jgi:gas vesicle protein
MTKHRADMKYWQQGKRGKTTSFEILQYTDAYIEVVENHPCLCREELLRREGEIIRATECVNKRIEGRTQKQYREDNADKIKQYHKQHYQDNADKIKQLQKQWREDNADKIKQKVKQWQEDNADKIKQHQKQKHDCDCGGKYTYSVKSKHLKTKKHQEFEAFMALTEEQVKMMLS